MVKKFFFFFLIVIPSLTFAQVRILFDATKAETAGNADWVIDADQFNIGWNPDAQLFNGDDANAQRLPSPAQSGVTTSTPPTYWEGGISSWGIDCVKQGYEVETLPYNGSITFNNLGNAQDLSNYKIFIVCEPNILFTSAEKSAILNFVNAGGSLFMISDHDQSDRNFDGYDSPSIWNDLMNNNPFGITFNLNNFSENSTSVIGDPNDSIANGPFGSVAQVLWSGGTDMNLNPIINPSVKGVVFRNGFLNNNAKAMFAYSRYGAGKVAAMGDSSPADDGSGDPNDFLYDGYLADAAGNHRKLIMNATIWLATADSTITRMDKIDYENQISVFAVGKNIVLVNHSSADFKVSIHDLLGNSVIKGINVNPNSEISFTPTALSGIYIVNSTSEFFTSTKKIFISK